MRCARVTARGRLASVVICAALLCAIAPAQAAIAARGGVVLSVAPIPTAAHPKPGTPQVNWSTGDGSPGEVTVTPAESKEALFGTGADGSAPAPWISVGRSYVFRLYSIASGRRLLARLTVGRQQSPTEVVAVPPRPKITPSAVNRLLQILAIGSMFILAVFALMHLRELRRDG
jgi:hypothetical protein